MADTKGQQSRVTPRAQSDTRERQVQRIEQIRVREKQHRTSYNKGVHKPRPPRLNYCGNQAGKLPEPNRAEKVVLRLNEQKCIHTNSL